VRDTPFEEIREPVRALCNRFGPPYWQKLDRENAYPEEFVRALTEGAIKA